MATRKNRTYSTLNPTQRKDILKQQIQQFEQEMFGHDMNATRAQALLDAQPDPASITDDEKRAAVEQKRSDLQQIIDNSNDAMDTLESAIATTKATQAAL